jgi:hypothetical protein
MLVDSLRKKGKIYKKMQEITPKELGIRNKIKIYKATDMRGYFWAIIIVEQKSRVLLKDVAKFEEILGRFTRYVEHNFKYKIIFIKAPLCSKAKEGFKSLGWRVEL